MTLFKSWVLIVVLACLLIGIGITLATGFAVPRESYINTTFGDPPTWRTYGAPWEWRTDGPRIWIEITEADRSPFGYGFNGISMGVFVLDAVAWGLLAALVTLPLLLLASVVQARRSAAAP